MWTVLWVLLVVSALRLVALLGVDLARRATALAEALAAAAATLERLEERAAEVEAGLSRPEPVDLDLDAARRRHDAARLVTARRREARAERHAAAYTRWRALSR